MKNKDLIIAIVDRSGSMASSCVSAERGLNTFIESQQALKEPATFFLTEFDTEITMHDPQDIAYVAPYVLEPRGMTALHDAIGCAFEQVAALDLEQGGMNMCVILTDGFENSSVEHTASSVRAIIKDREANGWEFIFLGASIEASREASNLGIVASKTVVFDNSAGGYNAAYGAVAAATTSFRSGLSSEDSLTNAKLSQVELS
jgi:Mg-chelatase subunit ChlD